MFPFERISVKQIQTLSEVISESSLLESPIIEPRYSKSALNFSDTIEFLQELNLIEIRNTRIIVKRPYSAFLSQFRESRQPDRLVRDLVIERLLNHRCCFTGYLHEFLSQFHLKNEQYEFVPTVAQRLQYSGIRNFLIDLGLITVASGARKYVIASDDLLVRIEPANFVQVSPEQFLEVQRRRMEIGRTAELRIIEYEKERLAKSPGLADQIEHTASKDVNAGYDITSFEEETDENGIHATRFIEVKAVPSWGYRFYWTRNEIEKSSEYGNSYCLYLLPVLGWGESFDIKSLRIIRDPYRNVYNNRHEWIGTEELLSFSQLRDRNDSVL